MWVKAGRILNTQCTGDVNSLGRPMKWRLLSNLNRCMWRGPSLVRRAPSRRTSALGQNKDDRERIRVDDDDSAIGQHEIFIGFVSRDDLDDSRWQATQFDLLPRNLDTH